MFYGNITFVFEIQDEQPEITSLFMINLKKSSERAEWTHTEFFSSSFFVHSKLRP